MNPQEGTLDPNQLALTPESFEEMRPDEFRQMFQYTMGSTSMVLKQFSTNMIELQKMGGKLTENIRGLNNKTTQLLENQKIQSMEIGALQTQVTELAQLRTVRSSYLLGNTTNCMLAQKFFALTRIFIALSTKKKANKLGIGGSYMFAYKNPWDEEIYIAFHCGLARDILSILDNGITGGNGYICRIVEDLQRALAGCDAVQLCSVYHMEVTDPETPMSRGKKQIREHIEKTIKENRRDELGFDHNGNPFIPLEIPLKPRKSWSNKSMMIFKAENFAEHLDFIEKNLECINECYRNIDKAKIRLKKHYANVDVNITRYTFSSILTTSATGRSVWVQPSSDEKVAIHKSFSLFERPRPNRGQKRKRDVVEEPIMLLELPPMPEEKKARVEEAGKITSDDTEILFQILESTKTIATPFFKDTRYTFAGDGVHLEINEEFMEISLNFCCCVNIEYSDNELDEITNPQEILNMIDVKEIANHYLTHCVEPDEWIDRYNIILRCC